MRTGLANGVEATVAGLHEWLMGAAQGPSGAFWAWCDLSTGQPSFEYPEITGYVLTYLAGLASLSARERAVGERAGSWLIRRFDRGDLSARDGWDNGTIYLFDLAMVAAGLLSFGRRIHAERPVESGLRLVALLRRALEEDPTFSPTSSRTSASERRAWSTHGRAHLAKIVQALLLGEDVSDRGATRLIEHVKCLQHDDGRIETGPEPETMLHPHLYAAEGLWIWGTARGDRDALERARAAVTWAWKEQLPTGGLPRSAASAAPVEQSDVTAQALRLALALGMESAEIDQAVARLIGLTRGLAEDHGIVYQPAAARAHVNTCATLFAAQALASAVLGAPPIPWYHLV